MDRRSVWTALFPAVVNLVVAALAGQVRRAADSEATQVYRMMVQRVASAKRAAVLVVLLFRTMAGPVWEALAARA